MTRWLSRFVALGCLMVPLAANAATYEIDPVHSHVGFTINHMVFAKVRGEFQKFTGTVIIDDKDFTKSTLDVSIEAASINTHNAKRDEHLRSDDFFAVAKHPTIRFVSKSVKKGPRGWKVVGDLTMRGVTKEVTLDVDPPSAEIKSPSGPMVRAVSARTKINRKNWEIAWNKSLESGGLLVGEDVEISLEVELIKK